MHVVHRRFQTLCFHRRIKVESSYPTNYTFYWSPDSVTAVTEAKNKKHGGHRSTKVNNCQFSHVLGHCAWHCSLKMLTILTGCNSVINICTTWSSLGDIWHWKSAARFGYIGFQLGQYWITKPMLTNLANGFQCQISHHLLHAVHMLGFEWQLAGLPNITKEQRHA